jgi:GTP pyrophosphokinase
MFRFPIEVQIRTYEMERIAEFGVAAHFAYSEKKGNIIPTQQSERIEKLQGLVNEYKESEDKDNFKKELNIEMLNKATFLYTPK